MIWFAGNVQIDNTLYVEEKANYSDALVFEKDFKSKNIIHGGTSLYFLKKIEVTQIFYSQINSEGNYSTKNADKSISIQVDNNQIWTVNGKSYNLGYEIDSDALDKIFVDKGVFFYFDEEADKYYELEEDEHLVEAILKGQKIFNI